MGYAEVYGYAEMCAAAATAQGIDQIADALRANALPVQVEQTGGFTMVAVVRLNGHVVAITDEGSPEFPAYLVGHYPGTSWDEGEGDVEEETTDYRFDVPTLREVCRIVREMTNAGRF